MKNYADSIREYEIMKTILIITFKYPMHLERKLKQLAKELKI